MQRQHWQIKPVLSAAVRGNTGDGVRMAQAVGAGLWHMWHFHGSYGFRHPDPAFPFGIRLKRLPDWTPGRPQRNDVRMSWILLDRAGRLFMNEYDPYLQDTGHRLLEQFDPITQSYPRIPATLLLDAAGRRQYALSAPTWHDREVAARFAARSPRRVRRGDPAPAPIPWKNSRRSTCPPKVAGTAADRDLERRLRHRRRHRVSVARPAA